MPHIMKHSSLFFAFIATILAFAMSSCNDMAVSTPELWYAKLMIRNTPAGTCDTIPYTDTIHVGDSLRWNLLVDGRYNTLQRFEATCDTSVFLLSVEIASVDSIPLAAGTDLEHGKIVFASQKVYACPIWLHFSPRKTGTHKIQMVIASDAGQGYSPRSWEYTSTITDSIPAAVADTTSQS